MRKIDGFRQKRFTGLLELIQLYKQNPLEKFFIFTIYQSYTLALTLKLEIKKFVYLWGKKKSLLTSHLPIIGIR